MDLSTYESASVAIGFLLPGLLILYARSITGTGRIPGNGEGLLIYLAVSVVYLGIALPAYNILIEKIEAPIYRNILWYALIVALPLAIGLSTGLLGRYAVVRNIFARLRISLNHPLPTSWDYIFSQNKTFYLIVTLSDERKFYGYWGELSFASTSTDERDLYIEKIFDLSENNEWIDAGEKGVLISKDAVTSIEVIPVPIVAQT